MFGFQRGGLAKAGHIGAQVIEPNLFGVALIALAPGEEQHIGLDALSVENTGGQTEDGVQITLVHQVTADLLAVAVGKEHIVRQHHGSPGLVIGFQAAVDVLEKVELLVAGGKVKSSRVARSPPFLVPKGGLVSTKSKSWRALPWFDRVSASRI